MSKIKVFSVFLILTFSFVLLILTQSISSASASVGFVLIVFNVALGGGCIAFNHMCTCKSFVLTQQGIMIGQGAIQFASTQDMLSNKYNISILVGCYIASTLIVINIVRAIRRRIERNAELRVNLGEEVQDIEYYPPPMEQTIPFVVTNSPVPTPHARECTICMELLSNPDSIIALPCAHVFHSSCIREWLSKQTTCPMCSTVVNASYC